MFERTKMKTKKQCMGLGDSVFVLFKIVFLLLSLLSLPFSCCSSLGLAMWSPAHRKKKEEDGEERGGRRNQLQKH